MGWLKNLFNKEGVNPKYMCELCYEFTMERKQFYADVYDYGFDMDQLLICPSCISFIMVQYKKDFRTTPRAYYYHNGVTAELNNDARNIMNIFLAEEISLKQFVCLRDQVLEQYHNALADREKKRQDEQREADMKEAIKRKEQLVELEKKYPMCSATKE